MSMERIETIRNFSIQTPELGDEEGLAPMHVQAWKETYVNDRSGLTDSDVDEMLKSILTDLSFRRNTIQDSLNNPTEVLYRVVKNNANKIVGFLHADQRGEFNELAGIYLLNEAKGTGIGQKLMEEFLLWSDKSKASRLVVFSFNNSAISFYNKYGFKKTDAPEGLYKNRLPYIEMIRP